MKYSQRARRRRVDYNNQRPDLSEQVDPTGYWRGPFDSSSNRLETTAPESTVDVIDLTGDTLTIMTATCPLATSVDLTGDDAEDEEAATQSPLLFVGTPVDPSPIVSATCPLLHLTLSW